MKPIIERESATFRAVVEEIDRRLAEHRMKNDAPADAETTAARRGAIKECKQLLAWLNPIPTDTTGER